MGQLREFGELVDERVAGGGPVGEPGAVAQGERERLAAGGRHGHRRAPGVGQSFLEFGHPGTGVLDLPVQPGPVLVMGALQPFQAGGFGLGFGVLDDLGPAGRQGLDLVVGQRRVADVLDLAHIQASGA
ncbi:hypothetical protein [Amycolatopsis thermophila]|uniref:Uncharacterized protein n=1 Tax=Amycolatopsis thermophila TaxID=206084 RepID=A0ABU0F580_9PSEU|nr:hypothetical protein [Amycolatopsis thermophila]MDQ0382648.1 hypothetical protein [Amycolatopsis thermophila]